MTVTPQVLVGERYRPAERLAAGGMGEIWRGEDTLLGRPVAIKVLRADYADDTDFRERFRAEARHAAVLTHPNVTQVFDFVDDATPCIVMEYVAGEPLSAILAREAPLESEQTWSIIGQTAAALAAAHGLGIVHRDIKPGNILVCRDGLVKVTDFGIARAFDEATATHPGIILGTAYYLAPEQLAGERATPASDMYALGVVGYECITGRPPFHGDTPEILRAHQVAEPPPLPAGVPPALADLVVALLAKDPADRPSDAAAIASHAHRMATRQELAGVIDQAPADPYPADGARDDAPISAADPVTRVLAFDGREPDAATAETSAIAAPVPSRRPRANVGRLRREHPALLAVGALVILVLAVTLLANRVLSTGPSPRGAAPATPTHGLSPAAKPVRLMDVALVGSGDHPEELHYVTDSSVSTAWYTEHYASAAFGGLKSGVGLQLRPSSPAAVKSVVFRFTHPGLAVKLYAGDAPSGTPLAATSSAPVQWRVSLPTGEQSRTLLLWITRLVPDAGGYRAGVADVRLLGSSTY